MDERRTITTSDEESIVLFCERWVVVVVRAGLLVLLLGAWYLERWFYCEM